MTVKRITDTQASAVIKRMKKSRIRTLKSWGGDVGDKLAELFERELPDGTPLVPSEGDASTDLGQLIRGMNTIMYRYYNDGDLVGIGYGKETLDWVIDYMLDASKDKANIADAIEEFYEDYSAFDIDFKEMDKYELQDYVNEALGTNFSYRDGEPEEPEEPYRDGYDSDEEYEEAMLEYEAQMEEYNEEMENWENFEYYMDEPGSFALDYGGDFESQAIESANSGRYEERMIALGKLIADYVERELMEKYELADSYANELDIYAPDDWENWEYDDSARKSRKTRKMMRKSVKKDFGSKMHELFVPHIKMMAGGYDFDWGSDYVECTLRDDYYYNAKLGGIRFRMVYDDNQFKFVARKGAVEAETPYVKLKDPENVGECIEAMLTLLSYDPDFCPQRKNMWE